MSIKTKNTRLYLLLILALLGLLFVSQLLAPPAPSTTPSFDNPDPKGLLALRLLLQQVPDYTLTLGDSSQLTAQQADAATSLLITEPAGRAFKADEAKKILDWVHAGGRLLLLYNGLEGEAAVGLEAFNRILHIKVRGLVPEEASVIEHGGIMQGINKLDDFVYSVFSPLPSAAISLAEVAQKGALLFAMSYGEGQVIALSQLELFDNAHLGDDDNARLAVQMIAPRGQSLLHIDETHHTAIHRQGQAAAFGQAGFRAFFYGLAISALFFIISRRRRGALRSPLNSPGFHASANARALARLYRDSGDIQGLQQRLQALRDRHGLDASEVKVRNLQQWHKAMRETLREIKDQ